VNERFCHIADRPRNQLVGLNWLEISKDPKWNTALSEFESMLKSGRGQFRVERSYSDPKRDPFLIDMSITLVHDAQNLPLFYLAVVQDVSEGKRAEARERLLSREVDHRSKNVLAIVQAIIHMTEAPDIKTYRTRIAGRIQSLSRTHNLLAETKWDGVRLSRVVQDEISPFEAADETASDHGRFTVTGPEVVLKPTAAQAFALLLHEMITNAVKYGALTAPKGHIQIQWAQVAGEKAMLRFVWREAGGPAVKEPDRNGFGWTVIRSSVEEQMRGTVKTQWTNTGLDVALEIPLREITDQPALAPAD
jgi:two-component sensor histidine kinase